MGAEFSMKVAVARLLSVVAVIGVGAATEPPAPLLERLSSERYPERVRAERELGNWAAGAGDAGRDWLAETAASAPDPELRERAESVLREMVLADFRRERPGYVGVAMQEVRLPEEFGEGLGVRVTQVQSDTPADQAGLRVGDLIVSLNGGGWREAGARDRFADQVGSLAPGTRVRLGVVRGNELKEFEVELTARPFSLGEYGEGTPFQRMEFGGGNRFGPAPRREEDREAAAEERLFRRWLDARRDRNGEDAAGESGPGTAD